MASPASWSRRRILGAGRGLIRLARSPALRQRMGEAGHAIVAERFSIDAQVRRIEALYDEELQRAGALAALGGRNGTAPDAATPSPARPRRPRRHALAVLPSALRDDLIRVRNLRARSLPARSGHALP